MNNAAVQALREGHYVLAREKAGAAIENDPQFAMPYYNLALVDILEGDFEKAKSNLRQCVTLDNRHGEAHLLLGLLLEREGTAFDGQPHYREAVVCFTSPPVKTFQSDLYAALTTYLAEGLAPGLEALGSLLAKYPDETRLQDIVSHVHAGDRGFFLNWLIQQYSPKKLAQDAKKEEGQDAE